MTAVHFADSDTGWAVGYGGTLMKSTNGGMTWNYQSLGSNKVLKSLFFIDAQTGWVVGWDGFIVKTSDGGVTWREQVSNTY